MSLFFGSSICPHHCCSLVFLAVVSQDKILELHLHLDPFLISQSGPDVVWFCNSSLVWLQDHLCPVIVHMQGTQNQDETGESLGRDMAVQEEVRCLMSFPHVDPILPGNPGIDFKLYSATAPQLRLPLRVNLICRIQSHCPIHRLKM